MLQLVHCPGTFLVRGELQHRRKPKCAKYSQSVLGETLVCPTYAANRAFFYVLASAVQVNKSAMGGVSHCVNGEIPSAKVVGELVRKGDRVGMPSVVVCAVDTVGGDFNIHTVLDNGEGAVLQSCFNHTAIGKDRLHFLGFCRGRYIVIFWNLSHY